MTNYNLNNINDKEFEILTRDLFQKELDLKLESFKRGQDTGIDLRYSKPFGKNDIIIQAKHWFQSTFEKLYNELIKNELPKVQKIKPKRYILATSIGLLPQQKDKLKAVFEPYIQTTGDIWGQDDINNQLNVHKDIAISHYKLWLTSSAVLLNILNNGIKGRSNFIVEEIEKNVRLFVPTKSYDDALNILKKEKFLILTGEPGIGKTTLANHIFFGFLASDYELIYSTDIQDAENVFDPNTKQIFYSDDFLGANYLELLNPQNTDSNIVNFINRVAKSENKLMVLTTRTTILNRAMQISGKFQLANLDLRKYEIKIQNYSKYDKAKILYNHITFSGLKDEYRAKIIEDKNYSKLINHRNFNPRIIEYITKPNNLKETKSENYFKFIEDKLKNPQMIWKDPYENQLDDYSRFMVTTLFCVGNVNENNFKEAFLNRLQYEIINNGFKRINNPYNNKLKELLGSFITRTFDGRVYTCNFFNPSIVDFLINYLNESKDEVWRILESAIFVEQFTRRFSLTDKSLVYLTDKDYGIVLDILRRIESGLKSINNRYPNLLILKFYLEFPIYLIKDDVFRIYSQINLEEITPLDCNNFISIIKSLINLENIKDVVINHWSSIIFKILEIAHNEDQLMEIKDLFEIYEIDYDEFSSKNGNMKNIQNLIDDFWGGKVDEIIEELKDETVLDLHDLQSEYNRRIENIAELNSEFNIMYSSGLEDLDMWDYEEWFKELLRDRYAEESEDEYYHNMNSDPFTNNYSNSQYTPEDKSDEIANYERQMTEDEKIDDLFSE